MSHEPTVSRRRLIRFGIAGGAGLAGAALLAACGERAPVVSSGPAILPAKPPTIAQPAAAPAVVHTDGHEIAPLLFPSSYVSNAADIVKAADWSTMQTVRLEMREFSYTPSNLSFVVGQPYKLELVNAGDVKHESTAEDFFRSAAFRKAEDQFSEFKAPFLHEVEVFPGQQTDLYFVPCHTGNFDLVCEIEGHLEAGMHGHFAVTGGTALTPAPVVTPIASGSWVQDGKERVKAANWDDMQTIPIEMGEFWFRPDEIHLKVNQPYKLELHNLGAVKHECTSEEFFQTVAFRKAENGAVELKAPRPIEVEVFAGKQTDLYLIPTKVGEYELVCEIEGHYEAGMHGTFVVE